ncbi:MAG TPA: RecX family transcriptional regulator [Terriglobia bacterium]|nr:RecX family transcriptional regulator [Terriglobia bacterium]
MSARRSGFRTSKKPAATPLEAALAMLARRPYSVAEMRRALVRKFKDDEEGVQQAVARLRELGYLDDRKFAAHHAASLAQNRGLGRLRIRRQLKAKLVDYKAIEPALQEAFSQTNEQEILEQVLEKKIRTLRLPITQSKLHSLCQSLMRRGFRAGDIMKAVRARPELKPVADAVDLTETEATTEES